MKSDMHLIANLTRNMRSAASAVVAGGALLCAGCGQQAADAPASKTDAPATADAHDHAHEGHSHEGESGDIAAAMAKLSAKDRALAETQKVCVVANEPLGSMGTPIKVEHDGQVAFLCCAGCKEAFEADPQKFLAALKEGGEAAAVPAPEGETAPVTDPAAEPQSEGT